VIYGSTTVGLSRVGDQLWNQDAPGINGAIQASDNFGFSLASGDFNGDGFDDLAVGVPFEDAGGKIDGGAVNVIYGSTTVGLSRVGDQLWNQDAPRINGAIQASDNFGFSLASGDFNGDGFDDLAVGVPFEDAGGKIDAGAVNVIYGSTTVGLSRVGDQLWNQDAPGINGAIQASDNFGSSLNVCDFNGDGFDDLAVGVPFEDAGEKIDGGAVNVIYGSTTVGLSRVGDQLWNQDAPGINGSIQASDNFGILSSFSTLVHPLP